MGGNLGFVRIEIGQVSIDEVPESPPLTIQKSPPEGVWMKNASRNFTTYLITLTDERACVMKKRVLHSGSLNHFHSWMRAMLVNKRSRGIEGRAKLVKVSWKLAPTAGELVNFTCAPLEMLFHSEKWVFDSVSAHFLRLR